MEDKMVELLKLMAKTFYMYWFDPVAREEAKKTAAEYETLRSKLLEIAVNSGADRVQELFENNKKLRKEYQTFQRNVETRAGTQELIIQGLVERIENLEDLQYNTEKPAKPRKRRPKS